MRTDLNVVLANAPRESWLALSEEGKIVGRGDTIKEAVEEAKGKGVDDPIVQWIPKTWIPAVYIEGGRRTP